MGCWNKTCGLSNLHIKAGTPVYVFPLCKQSHHSRSYTSAFWKPAVIPFTAEYDDYGAGENCAGLGLELLLDSIAPYATIEKFFKRVNNVEGDIDFVMFRKDVVDDILTNHKFEMYVGGGKGNGGYDNAYLTYGYSDIIATLPEYIDKWLQVIKEDAMYTAYPDWSFLIRTLEKVYKYEEHNLADEYIRSLGFSHNLFLTNKLFEKLSDAVQSNDVEKLTELLTLHIMSSFLDKFMDSVRKVWLPGGHEGSQAQEHRGYRTLVNVITKMLDKENNDERED